MMSFIYSTSGDSLVIHHDFYSSILSSLLPFFPLLSLSVSNSDYYLRQLSRYGARIEAQSDHKSTLLIYYYYMHSQWFKVQSKYSQIT